MTRSQDYIYTESKGLKNLSEIVEMEKTFSKIKTLKSRRKLSLPAAASPLIKDAGNSESNTSNDRPQVE